MGSDVTIPCRPLASLKLSVQGAPDAGTEGDAVTAQQAVVNNHALERQQDRLRQDRQVGTDQFLKGLRKRKNTVGDGLLVGREKDHVLFQLPKNVEPTVNKMRPGAHDVEFLVGQVGWVFSDKLLDEVHVAQESIPDLGAQFR